MVLKRRFFESLLTLLFLAALFIPLLAGVLFEDAQRSASENRALSTFPALPQSVSVLAQFRDQMGDYYDDHFGFRETLVQLYYRIKHWLGDSPSANVIIGEQGWLFYNHKQDGDPVGDYRNINVFSESQLAQISRALVTRQRWLNQRGIVYLFVIAPNKHSIYSEFLPRYINKVNPQSAYDQIVQYLRKNTTINIVDLRSALLKAKTKETPVYWQTDTHWNYYGANIAQYQIAEAIATLVSGKITPILWQPDQFHWGSRAGGDLAINIGMTDQVVDNHPILTQALCHRRIPVPEQKAQRDTLSTVCESAQLSALIFRDSFFDFAQPFFSEYFNKATYVWLQPRLADVQEFVEKEHPDVVIEEWVERYLRVLDDD